MDAGPLVALIDADDLHHARCVATLQKLREPLATAWPPFTEAMYLLADIPKAQDALCEMVERGALNILSFHSADMPRIRELMRKYADRPMDFADAALLRVAEREGIRTIFTIDRKDFSVYRLHNRVRPLLLP